MTPREPKRFEARKDDGGWERAVAWIIRYRGLVTLLTGGALGSALWALVMRFLLVAQLNAQDVNHTTRMNTIEAAVRGLELQMGAVATLVRAECDRKTQAEQVRLQMTCPAALYKGAP